MVISASYVDKMKNCCEPVPVPFQVSGFYGTEFLADSADLTIDSGQLIAQASTDLTGFDERNSVSRSIQAGDFLTRVEIDLMPIGGGHGELGESAQSTTSECVVYWKDGTSQNMDGGGSISICSDRHDGMAGPCNFDRVEILQGSGIKVSYTITGNG